MKPTSRRAGVQSLAGEWILPPGIKRVLKRQRRSWGLLLRTDKATLAANARLQGAYQGRRCFVLGNGPSLASVDIEPLGGEVTVVMNHFNRHPVLRIWQPVVHCAAEPAAAYDSPDGRRYLQQMLSNYTTTTHVFPMQTKMLFDRMGLVPSERLVLVEQGGEAVEYDHIDLTEPVPIAHDTSILAVSIAIAMGCDPIILLGLDYSWLSHRSVNTHFYDDATASWPVEDLSRTPYLEVMRQSVSCWEAHAALRRIAAKSGQAILNATEGSFLDVYPMTTFGEVVGRF